MAARTPETPDFGDTIRQPETTHAFLRRVTRGWHERVDAAYAGHDLTSRAGLGAFLLRQAAALGPLEQRIETCGAAAMLPDWNARRRWPAILADLAQLGMQAPAVIATPALPSRHHGVGALYVLEGSKLGGRVLLRMAVESPDPDVHAATRFLGHPNGGGWARFLAVLNALPQTADTVDAMRHGAVAAFAAFLSAAGPLPPPRRAVGSDRAPALVDADEA